MRTIRFAWLLALLVGLAAAAVPATNGIAASSCAWPDPALENPGPHIRAHRLQLRRRRDSRAAWSPT